MLQIFPTLKITAIFTSQCTRDCSQIGHGIEKCRQESNERSAFADEIIPSLEAYIKTPRDDPFVAVDWDERDDIRKTAAAIRNFCK